MHVSCLIYSPLSLDQVSRKKTSFEIVSFTWIIFKKTCSKFRANRIQIVDYWRC